MPFSKRIRGLISHLGALLFGQLRSWTKPVTETAFVKTVTDLTRSRRVLLIENGFLRQQLVILKRQVKRPQLRWRDRAVIVALASRLTTWKQALLMVKPEMVLGWHRDLFRCVWRRKSRPKPTPGRSRLP